MVSDLFDLNGVSAIFDSLTPDIHELKFSPFSDLSIKFQQESLNRRKPQELRGINKTALFYPKDVLITTYFTELEGIMDMITFFTEKVPHFRKLAELFPTVQGKPVDDAKAAEHFSVKNFFAVQEAIQLTFLKLVTCITSLPNTLTLLKSKDNKLFQEEPGVPSTFMEYWEEKMKLKTRLDKLYVNIT